MNTKNVYNIVTNLDSVENSFEVVKTLDLKEKKLYSSFLLKLNISSIINFSGQTMDKVPTSCEKTTYLDNEEIINENASTLDDVNNNISNTNFFSLPLWLFIIMLSISTWIIVANSFVLLCLINSRNALKNSVNVQLLSLSLTDLLVGITAIPGTLFPIVFQNTKYETCAFIMYMYFFAQSATLCHTLLICVNRLRSIKRKANVNDSSFIKHLLQILAVWGFCLLFYVIHFLSFARFGETVKHCSTIYLFEGNEFVAFALLTIPPLVPPQLCTNIIYVYLFIYVRKRLRSVGVINVAPKHATNDDELACCRAQENHLSKSNTLGGAHTINLVSLDTTVRGSSSSTIKTMVPSVMHEPKAGPSTACESKRIKDNYTNRKFQAPAANTRENKTCGENKQGGNQTCNSRVGWKTQNRVMVTFGILLMSLNVFMTPLDFIVVIQMINGRLSRGVRFLFVTMALLNSAFNPIINIGRVRPFRLIIRKIVIKIYECLNCRRT